MYERYPNKLQTNTYKKTRCHIWTTPAHAIIAKQIYAIALAYNIANIMTKFAKQTSTHEPTMQHAFLQQNDLRTVSHCTPHWNLHSYPWNPWRPQWWQQYWSLHRSHPCQKLPFLLTKEISQPLLTSHHQLCANSYFRQMCNFAAMAASVAQRKLWRNLGLQNEICGQT